MAQPPGSEIRALPCRARIGPSKYDGEGTGFLFDGARIGEKWKGESLLLTNAHVCSDDPEVQKQYPYPSPPEELTAAFLGTGDAASAIELKFRKLIWTSKPSELDATLLLLENAPDSWKPLPITTRTPPVTLQGEARLNILGHPKGQDLRISLFSHLQTLPLATFDKNPAGRLITRVTNDISSMADMFSAGFVTIIGNFLTVVGILAWLLEGGPVYDESGQEVKRVHVYGDKWDFAPTGYESVKFSLWQQVF